jgi:glucosamine--fructose-6-phosphate aminotransferase (isomerizing)
MRGDVRLGIQTIAEISSQAETWELCGALLESSDLLDKINQSLPGDMEWVFVGCGSSYFLAEVAATTWTLSTGLKARAFPASEILLFPKLFPQRSQPVLISRSGETSEVIEAAEHLRRNRSCEILGITCASATRLEKLCHLLINLSPAEEKSTVMTRSFTSMLLGLQLLAAQRAGEVDIGNIVRSLSAGLKRALPLIQTVIADLVDSEHFEYYVFLGQGPFFGIAQEAMLKVKEMSCSYAQSFHTLEFRHGPKAIVSPKTLVTFFMSETASEAERAVLEEVKHLGARVIAVMTPAAKQILKAADHTIQLHLDVPQGFRAAAALIPAQLLGYYTGLRRGFDPDHPRHLTKVVTLQGRNGGGADSGA